MTTATIPPYIGTLKQYVEVLLSLTNREWTEYNLLQAVHRYGMVWPFTLDSSELSLFRQHFSIMHVLYQLRRKYKAQGLDLTISALSIQLNAMSCHECSKQPLSQPGIHALEAFYSDWIYFESATADSVRSLLTQFWERYLAYQNSDKAYQVMGLPIGTDRKSIERRYRQLAMKHHPDKGGNADHFVEIKQAYESLMQSVGN